MMYLSQFFFALYGAVKSSLTETIEHKFWETKTKEEQSFKNAFEFFVGILICAPFLGPLYLFIGYVASLRGVDYGPLLYLKIDSWLPYVPSFVIPYVAGWFLPILSFPFLVWLNPPAILYRKLVMTCLLVYLIQTVIWIIFPVSDISVRVPLSVIKTVPYSFLREPLFLVDQVSWHFNAFPSNHVSISWVLFRTIQHTLPRYTWLFGVIIIPLILGTVFIKVHYILDGIAGIILAETVFRWVMNSPMVWLEKLSFLQVIGVYLLGGVLILTTPVLTYLYLS